MPDRTVEVSNLFIVMVRVKVVFFQGRAKFEVAFVRLDNVIELSCCLTYQSLHTPSLGVSLPVAQIGHGHGQIHEGSERFLTCGSV